MSVSIRLDGLEQTKAFIRNASQEVQDAASSAVTATALELRGDVVQSIQRGPESGKTYQKYNPRRTHRASAPGQAPMSDTGRLANSITFDQIGPLTATVGSNLVYAVHLEYGTSRMAARPFFRPAVERMRIRFQDRLDAAIAGALR